MAPTIFTTELLADAAQALFGGCCSSLCICEWLFEFCTFSDNAQGDVGVGNTNYAGGFARFANTVFGHPNSCAGVHCGFTARCSDVVQPNVWDKEGPYLAIEYVLSSDVTLRCLSFARYGPGSNPENPAYVDVPANSPHNKEEDKRWYGTAGHPCDICSNGDEWPKYQTNNWSAG